MPRSFRSGHIAALSYALTLIFALILALLPVDAADGYTLLFALIPGFILAAIGWLIFGFPAILFGLLEWRMGESGPRCAPVSSVCCSTSPRCHLR